ncbi:MAG: FtsW/RodA/SpoVE family cell cycle protein, partial [Anaerolineae bacterium]|nr:FtsW/RodA/SpoVE family cell cycle protein [Anaerolineae bacterium]
MRSAWKRFTTALDQNQQGSLLILAGLFLVFNAVTLSFSPAGRLRSWEAVYRWKHWAGLAVWAAGMLLIYRQSKKYLPAGDKLLAPAAALLSGWGLLMIWRLTGEFGLRQSIWLGISVLLFSAGLRFQGGLTLLRRYKYVWLFAGLGLTALTLFLGTNPLGFGPRLWLGCCGIYFQPSEPLKLLFIVYLAAYLSERRPAHTDILSLAAPTLVVTGLALLLLIFQRDLGTASIFVFIYTAVMYAATGQRRVLGISLIILLVSGAAGYTLYDVVRIRIDGWINPWLDPSGRSFQIVQSLMAVASGGIFGRGIGLGSPGLVPIAHSDFIFSSFSEEFGLVGIFPLLAVFAALTLRAIRIGAQAASHYHRFLALGLAAYFGSQSIYIIGGAIRLLPLTGVTLPFVSYGGSSLVTSFLALLILTRISARRGSPSLLPKDFPPLMMLTRIFLAGFSAVALAYGWWAVVRGPDLGTRTDNARRTIADRVVKRGAVLDRSGEKLIFTSGEQGDFQRSYTYPALSPILGYTHPLYGQAGAEAYIDPLLRGLEGQSPLKIWWQHLLYGQPPPGLDIRLTIDLSRQQKADGWLAGKAGS